MRVSFRSALGVALAVGLVLAACKKGGTQSSSTPTSPSSGTPTANTVTVDVVGSSGPQAYKPNPVAAAVGSTVRFKNNDGKLHRIVLEDGTDLGDMAPGATSNGFAVKSASPIGFHCKLHSSMVGAVNSATLPEPPPCPDPYGYGC